MRRILLVALLAPVLALAATLWATLPTRGPAAIAGLSAPVEVTLDAHAIPRIRAANAIDAAAALGWLHASERMFQMDMMRRAAAGELSELAGALTLPSDRIMRTLGLRQSAEADAAGLDGETRAVLEAYARGVNAYLARKGRFAALEFLPFGGPRPWTVADSLLWAKTMGLYLSGNWRTELARAQGSPAVWPPTTAAPHAAAPTARRLAGVLPEFPEPFTQPATASNAWAVAARHSASGAPLLAGDPHLGFALPGVWYLARIDTPGGTLAGATAPGVPFLVIGHNGRIAWSFTTTGADTQDLFVETPVGVDRYMTPQGPRAYALREERIRVRGQAEEVLTVRETRHGPVVSDLVAPDGPVLAVAMAGLAPGDTSAAGLLALNRAGTRAEAAAAAARITGLVQTMTVADRAGIALYLTGRVPIRRAGDGSRAAPGAGDSHDWIGWASGADLPQVVDPPSGRIATANERAAPADFPVFLGRDWSDDLRVRRAHELLAAEARHSQASFAAMQTDTVSLLARETLPRLRGLAVEEGLAARAQALLAGWDGDMRPDSAAPLVFHAWMREFARTLPAGEGAAPWWQLAGHALSAEGAAWCGAGCDAALREALPRALAPLAARLGPDPAAWRWGAVHRAAFAHPLLRGIPWLGDWTTVRLPVGGDGTTLLRANTGRDFDAVHGAGLRAVHDLADFDRAGFIVAPGQSGHLLLPAARSLAPLWAAGRLLPLGPVAEGPATRFSLSPGD